MPHRPPRDAFFFFVLWNVRFLLGIPGPRERGCTFPTGFGTNPRRVYRIREKPSALRCLSDFKSAQSISGYDPMMQEKSPPAYLLPAQKLRWRRSTRPLVCNPETGRVLAVNRRFCLRRLVKPNDFSFANSPPADPPFLDQAVTPLRPPSW